VTECHSAEAHSRTVSGAVTITLTLAEAAAGAVSRSGSGAAARPALCQAAARASTLFATGASGFRAVARAVAGILGTGCLVVSAARGILAAGPAVVTGARLTECARSESNVRRLGFGGERGVLEAGEEQSSNCEDSYRSKSKE